MNQIGLSLRQVDISLNQASKVEIQLLDIFVDGRSFIEIIRELEMPFAIAEGSPQIAGKYESVSAQRLRWDLVGGDDDKIVILDCDCGVPRCWPLLMRVQQGDGIIRWFDFEQPFRGPNREVWWRLDQIAPFEFETKQYDDQLSKIGEQL